MKYYWIALTIEIKSAVLKSSEINTKKLGLFYVIFAEFKSFQAIFIDFSSNFIDNFY